MSKIVAFTLRVSVKIRNGATSWKAATNINDLVVDVPGGLGRYRPNMEYLLLAERDFQDEELEPLKNLVAALFQLENNKRPEHLAVVIENLFKWLAGSEQDSLRRAFTVWFNRVLFSGKKDFANQLAIEELNGVRMMLAERVREWEQEWKREGRKDGVSDVLIRAA